MFQHTEGVTSKFTSLYVENKRVVPAYTPTLHNMQDNGSKYATPKSLNVLLIFCTSLERIKYH